jgi:hypothetical protein
MKSVRCSNSGKRDEHVPLAHHAYDEVSIDDLIHAEPDRIAADESRWLVVADVPGYMNPQYDGLDENEASKYLLV